MVFHFRCCEALLLEWTLSLYVMTSTKISLAHCDVIGRKDLRRQKTQLHLKFEATSFNANIFINGSKIIIKFGER